MKFTSYALAAVLALSASAQAQVLSIEKLGDDELTCQELYDETKAMDAILAQGSGNATATTAQSDTQAQQAQAAGNALSEIAARTGDSEVAGLGSIFGKLASIGGGTKASTQASSGPSAATLDTASKRKDRMAQLFKNKKCKVKSLKQ